MKAWLLLAAASGLLAGNSHQPPLRQSSVKEAHRPNPYRGQERAAQAGRKLFERECSACHGSAGQGSGWAPALASPSVRQSAPGALFWVLRNGSLRHGMPSFSHLPEQQRWQIVTYLQTL